MTILAAGILIVGLLWLLFWPGRGWIATRRRDRKRTARVLRVATLTSEDRFEPASHQRLSELDPGEQAKVVGVSRSCRGLERRRFMDLGILPGTIIEAELRSPSGDPTAYRVRGAVIALRREQSELIYIDRSQEASP